MTDIFVPFSPSGALFRLSVPPFDAIALADSLEEMGSAGAGIFDPTGRKVGGCALYGTAPDGPIIISLNLFDTASAEKIAAGVYVGAVLNTEQPGLILTDTLLVKGADGRLEKLNGRASGLALAQSRMSVSNVKNQLLKFDQGLVKAQSKMAELQRRLNAIERQPAVPKMPIRHRADDAIGA